MLLLNTLAGLHTCSSLKPRQESHLSKEIRSSNMKTCLVKRNILSSLINDGAAMSVVEKKSIFLTF